MRITCLALAMGIACATGSGAEGLDASIQQLSAARQVVKSHLQLPFDQTPDGTAASRDAVAREWSLLADLVATDLNARRDPTKDPSLKGFVVSVTSLAPDTFVVSVDIDDLGTVFVINRANGRFRPAWTIHHLTDEQLKANPLLRAFGAEAATAACNNSRTGDHPELCGPMTADIQRFGDDERGRARFSVNGYYSTQQGSDVGYVLSIWRWDNDKSVAVPELVGGYGQTLGTPIGQTFKAPFLTLDVKDWFETFFVTAPEAGRQMKWTILIDRKGVRDLGKISAVPELDAVDELFARLLNGLPTKDIAAPNVSSNLKEALREEGLKINRGEKGDDVIDALGELWAGEVSHVGNGSTLCFNADEVGGFLFVLTRNSGKGLFISDVTKLADRPGQGSPCPHRKS